MAGNTALTAIIVLLSLLFSPPQKGEKSPVSPKQSLRYTIPNANVIVSLNVTGIYQQLNAGLKSFSKDPFFQKPVLKSQLFKVQTQLQVGIQMATQIAGFNPLDAIRRITISTKAVPGKRKPQILVSFTGKIDKKKFLKLLSLSQKASIPQEVMGWTLLMLKRGMFQKIQAEMIAFSPDGQILIGKQEMIRKFVVSPPQPQTCPAKTAYCRMLLGYNPSDWLSLAAQLPSKLPPTKKVPGFIKSSLRNFGGLHVSLQVGRTLLTVWGTDPHSINRYHTLLQGAAHFAKSSDHAGRGLLFILKGLLDFNSQELPAPLKALLPMKDEGIHFLFRQFLDRPFTTKVTKTKEWARLEIAGPPTPLLPGLAAGAVGAGFFIAKSKSSQMLGSPMKAVPSKATKARKKPQKPANK